MQRAARPEQDRSCRHLGRDHFIGARAAISGPEVAAGNDVSATVGFGEVGYRPHAREDHPWARDLEKLIRILLAMEHLLARSGTDLEGGRRVYLVMRAVRFQDRVARRQHKRMRDEGSESFR